MQIVLVKVFYMAVKKAKTSVFDPKIFGELLREERRAAGFSSAPKFSEAIERETGIYIDKDTIHKIERGEREPDISKLIAMCETIAAGKQRGYAMLILESLLHNSQPIKFAFRGAKYAMHMDFCNRYIEKFKQEPSIKLVRLSVDPRIPIEYIKAEQHEKEFISEFRNKSKAFQQLKESYEIEQIKRQNIQGFDEVVYF